ncbi:hypothetical protein SORBI_3002G152000 [Sorghum bicolor]|uniref:RING-type domain-containing protein n=1 Tax=Sorghum bicolor TaxID=4558 RepID=A0A1B6QBI3_SORBI|nr:hypothetical protein SORBI_3002G152000 [Sorghum bicolor]
MEMETGSAQSFVLYAAMSLSCALLLLVVGEAGLCVASLALRGEMKACIDNASVFPDDDEPPPLPAESCDRLTIAVYRRGQGQGQEEQAEETDPDCAFCLSAVPDGEEVRELPTQDR